MLEASAVQALRNPTIPLFVREAMCGLEAQKKQFLTG
jgi:hypothetical protein